MGLLGLELANIYQNLTNIVVTITPMGCETTPAVLVNAHYDSAVGSPGQSPVQQTEQYNTLTQVAHVFCIPRLLAFL